MFPGDLPELGEVILEREIPSDVALVHPLVVRTVEFLNEEAMFVPREESRIALCLAEALVNAVVHGNGKQFEKKVKLKVFLGETEWGFVVEDEGKGFDLAGVPDPRDEQGVWTESGRGIHLMAHYMDRVEYYRNGSANVLAKAL
jgi:serine/threonine-protein kinase RsbW